MLVLQSCNLPRKMESESSHSSIGVHGGYRTWVYSVCMHRSRGSRTALWKCKSLDRMIVVVLVPDSQVVS